MALTNDYEPVQDSLLHQNLLPTLENALPCLKYEETRLELIRQKVGHAFAVGVGKWTRLVKHAHFANILVWGGPRF